MQISKITFFYLWQFSRPIFDPITDFSGISNSVIDYAGDITDWLIDLVTDAGLLRPADVTNIGSDMHLEVSEIFGP